MMEVVLSGFLPVVVIVQSLHPQVPHLTHKMVTYGMTLRMETCLFTMMTVMVPHNG